MIRIAITQAAFDAIAATLPLGSHGEIAFSDLLGEDYVQTFRFAYNLHVKRFVRWAGRYNKRARATAPRERRPARPK
jgi:hypothetical protein